MRPASKLPKRLRGWPGIEEIVVDPEDYGLFSRKSWVNYFEGTAFTAPDYIQVLDDLQNKVLKATPPKLIAGLNLYLHSIDQDGRACTSAGNEIICRIAQKFDCDFQQMILAPQLLFIQDIIGKVISRASWLYKATPSSMVAHIVINKILSRS